MVQPTAPRQLVVVGGGMVARRLVDALRSRDVDGTWAVTLLCEEPRAPYDRVALTSYFTGRDPDDLALGGQELWDDPMRRAEEETLAADLFVVLGSSLVVYPAAGFPALAKRNGARLVIINREATDFDRIADLVLHSAIGETFGRAAGVE